MKKIIPEFAADEQAERFVEAVDLTQFCLSGFKPTSFEFQVKAAQLNMRLPQTLLDAVRAAAKARGVPYTRFVRETLERVVADNGQSGGRGYTLQEKAEGQASTNHTEPTLHVNRRKKLREAS